MVTLASVGRVAQFAIRRIKWALGDRSPIVAYLKITRRCNLDCYYCPWHSSVNDYRGELSTDAWKDIISVLMDRGVRIVVFEGGEPTLRSDLADLLSYVDERGGKTILATNGFRPISLWSPTAFTISIDGPESLHDRVRGVGSYRRIIENLAKRKTKPVVAITVVSRNNRGYLRELLEAVSPLVDAFLFTFEYPYRTVPVVALPMREVAETKRELLALKAKYRILNPASHLAAQPGQWYCADWLAVTVNHEGHVEDGCFVQHVEPKDCSRCELGCFQVISGFHQFNTEAWNNLHRLLLASG
jgi:MoaA/NifB/PqqE/SkfB family radical SAM enzyme